MIKIGAVSLGCDKNRIDTENMLAYLEGDGFELTPDAEDADVIVVNTCAFIDSAKQEAVDTILEMAEYKKNKCRCLVVSGCLSQRYMDELKHELPEVDIFLGTVGYHKLGGMIREFYDGKRGLCLENDKNSRVFTSARVLTTPYHYAYIKVAEGCDNKCTYCAIPAIRGAFTSRPIDDIVAEAEALLAQYPIKEFILVAQDVSRYGEDIYGEVKLVDLLKRLTVLSIDRIRLLYLYPERITDELLDFMASSSKMCKYIDMPCQHISDKILKMMNRKIKSDDIRRLIGRIEGYGCFTLRSTFITGFPREDAADHEQLKSFIAEGHFDRCGFFTYSREEGTAAARLDGQIDEDIKAARQAELYALQQEVTMRKNLERVGKTYDVMYEGIDYDKGMFWGRSRDEAPEIDPIVYFTSDISVEIGEIYNVKIESVDGLDIVGRTV